MNRGELEAGILLDLQPLRIPAGWTIGWNTLYASSRVERGEFGGSSLFNATNPGRRFNVDVTFEPEFDPTGVFRIQLLYEPWPRTDRGRRRPDVPFALTEAAEQVHAFTTGSYAAMIAELEHTILRCSTWIREGN